MSGLFDMLWVIFCLFWVLSVFKAFKGGKPEKKEGKKGGFLEKAAVGLIGKEVFEEIRKEMKKAQPGKDKVLHSKPLQYKKEVKAQVGKSKKLRFKPFQYEEESEQQGEESNLGHYFKEDENEKIKKAVSDEKEHLEPKTSGLYFSDLRRGIIMAEILRPPKAKRTFGKL